MSTHYDISYPQNGDRVVTIDPVTSIHPMYCPAARLRVRQLSKYTLGKNPGKRPNHFCRFYPQNFRVYFSDDIR